MKLPVILSILLHVMFFAVLFALPSRSRQFYDVRRIYEVELVSLPRVVEEPPEETAHSESEPESEPESPVTIEPVESTVPNRESDDTEVSEPVEPESTEEESPADSTAAPGVGGSQVTVETQDFPFSYYLSLIRFRIQDRWRPPYQTTGESNKLVTVVGFRILRNGGVSEVDMENSSGRFLFDQAAIRAIRTLGQLPPLPAEFTGEYLTVHIEFESIIW